MCSSELGSDLGGNFGCWLSIVEQKMNLNFGSWRAATAEAAAAYETIETIRIFFTVSIHLLVDCWACVRETSIRLSLASEKNFEVSSFDEDENDVDHDEETT